MADTGAAENERTGGGRGGAGVGLVGARMGCRWRCQVWMAWVGIEGWVGVEGDVWGEGDGALPVAFGWCRARAAT